jgi:predicted O-methyltransferase YrrM
MDESLANLLAELERFGRSNDAAISERSRRMLNITRDTGEFLAVLVRATKARWILEIGTSNGYSTLWLAHAAHTLGGQVTSVDVSPFKFAMAAANFVRSGLGSSIDQRQDDAGRLLARQDDATFDLIFLDSERSEYPGWWPQISRVLKPGGLLVVDNATSHVQEMAPFVALVNADPQFTTCLVPVGNGEFMATRQP